MKPMDEVLDDFLERLEDGEPFAISRWGDGEYRLIQKTPLMRTEGQVAHYKAWSYNPYNPYDIEAGQRIVDSLSYEAEGLYWGIPCLSCSI